MKIINRVFIIICCGVCICLQGIDIKSVFAILMLICVASCGIYFNKSYNMCIVFCGYVVLTAYIKQAIYGLPLIIYEELNVCKLIKTLNKSDMKNNSITLKEELKSPNNIKVFVKCILSLVALLVLIIKSCYFIFYYKNASYNNILQEKYIIIIELMISVVAVMFNYYACKVNELNTDIKEIRDDSKELNMTLIMNTILQMTFQEVLSIVLFQW